MISSLLEINTEVFREKEMKCFQQLSKGSKNGRKKRGRMQRGGITVKQMSKTQIISKS